MGSNNTQVEVTLLGKTHQFACTEGQEQVLLDAVALLNQRVEETKKKSTVKNEQNALLLAALHLCHDLQACERQEKSQKEQQQSLIDKLTNHLAGN
jgi:cell division protein ZapA